MLDKHLTNGEKCGIVRMEESLKEEKQNKTSKARFAEAKCLKYKKYEKKEGGLAMYIEIFAMRRNACHPLLIFYRLGA